MKYQILLFYKYIEIDNPVRLMRSQKRLCEKLNLKGRIIIAAEGINGTVEGRENDTNKYIREMTKDKRFSDIDWKKSKGTGNAFPKLSVKVRNEIVSLHLGENDFHPTKLTGKYLTSEELHDWFEEKNPTSHKASRGREFYIIDMRNDYEYKSGFFEGSILPQLSNFRDLPKLLPKLLHLKNKTILTVCTGGVRCEKASGYLVGNGFNDVYQLKNGIVSYMEKYPNEHFKGKLYVFDGRVTMGFNTDDRLHEIVGRCENCEMVSEHYINCATVGCHRHFIMCENCLDKEGNGVCPKGCTYVRKRQRENPVNTPNQLKA